MRSQVFTIEISKNYRMAEWREDLKGLYRQAGGAANKRSVFLFDETQIKMEAFLEDVNNILTSGEVGGCAGNTGTRTSACCHCQLVTVATCCGVDVVMLKCYCEQHALERASQFVWVQMVSDGTSSVSMSPPLSVLLVPSGA